MKKKQMLWVLVIMAQVFLAVAVSSAVLWSNKLETSLEGTMIEQFNIGGMTREQAESALTRYFDDKIKNHSVDIEFNSRTYNKPLRLDTIGLEADYQRVLDEIYNNNKNNQFMMLIGATGDNESDSHSVSYIFNEGALKRFFTDMRDNTGIPAEDASFKIEDGEFVLKEGKSGVELDVDGAIRAFEKRLPAVMNGLDIWNLNEDGDMLLTQVSPGITADNYSGLERVVAESAISVDRENEKELYNYICTLSENGYVIVKPGQEFSLKDNLMPMVRDDNSAKAVNIFASAIYQTILQCEEIKVTYRDRGDTPVDFAPPGSESIINGDGDLRFLNRFGYNVMIYPDVTDGGISVYLVGNDSLKVSSVEYKIEQTLEPPVVYVKKAGVEKGSRKVITQGEKGYIVSVYRISGEQSELIYRDRYEPISSVVELGIETENESIINK